MDPKKEIKFMSYNVWSREDVVVYKRMQAISRLVCQHSPDVIFFQEVTPYIHRIFQSFSWWNDYHSSPASPEELTEKKHFCLMLSKFPLENYARWRYSASPTGRGYLEADITPAADGSSTLLKPIRIATTQLERPTSRESMHCTERYMQAEHAVAALGGAENVVFGGDMSWDDSTDMPFPLPAGWIDAGKLYDWTYNGVWEDMVVELNGYLWVHSTDKKRRSDRFVCKLQDYKLESISLIGDQSVGLSYRQTKKYLSLDYCDTFVKPSCHRGLVLTIVPNETAQQDEGTKRTYGWRTGMRTRKRSSVFRIRSVWYYMKCLSYLVSEVLNI